MGDRPPAFTGQMPSSFDENQDFYNEKALHKVVRKIKEEPLIPLGSALTVFAFVSAYRAIRRGDSKQANRMFRYRVGAQGFTVLAMLAGSMYYGKDREKTKELRKLKEEHDAEEKRQKWIRELEVRDDEEKATKSRILQMQQQRQRQQEEEILQQQQQEEAGGGGQGSGGIIGRMGLWSAAEEKRAKEDEAAASAAAADATETRPSKRENPNSSLGTLGEIVSTSNKKNPIQQPPRDQPKKDEGDGK